MTRGTVREKVQEKLDYDNPNQRSLLVADVESHRIPIIRNTGCPCQLFEGARILGELVAKPA